MKMGEDEFRKSRKRGLTGPKDTAVHLETGNIGLTLLRFALPIFFMQMLSQCYHIADSIVVGRFCEGGALAAVGVASLIISVLINFFLGFGVGISSLTAKFFGKRDHAGLKMIINTSLYVAIGFGALLTLVIVVFGNAFLHALSCPEEVIGIGTVYLRICAIGLTAQLFYNVSEAVLRALGDTKSPLIFLCIASALNIVLDIIAVAVLGYGVAGAAVATVVSQWVAALIMGFKICAMNSEYRFEPFGGYICATALRDILKIGLPSGFQAFFMSLSSLFIQVSINGFGVAAASGMIVYARVEGFLYYPAFAYGMALTGFVGQNLGCEAYDRIEKSIKISNRTLTAFTIVAGIVFMIFARPILSVFTTDAAIIDNGAQAVYYTFPLYFVYAINQVYIGGLKGLGDTVHPMIYTVICYFFIRVGWCMTVLPLWHDMRVIYLAYDISWIVMVFCLRRKYKKRITHFTHHADCPEKKRASLTFQEG